MQASAVTLTIATEPATVLPGVAPTLRVWVTNDGPAPVEVPTKVALQVIPPRGEPFVAFVAPRGDELTVRFGVQPPFVLAAGERRDVSFWGSDGWFSADARFYTTGAFRLQLIADDQLDSVKLAGVSRALDQPGLSQPIASNEITFTAVEPTGSDLEIWNLAKASNAGLCSPQIVVAIRERYPDSQYGAYCVEDYDDRDPLKRIAGYEQALAKGPHPLWAEYYRLNVADAWISQGWRLITEDIQASVEAYQRAQKILEHLTKDAISPRLRNDAANMLARVETREDIEHLYNRAHGVVEKVVRIGVNCFQTLPDGRYKVWFGHNNTTSESITLPVGNENKFTPPPFDRKQPTTFRPGIFHFDFSVITKEPVLVWHLQKKTAQFKLADSEECPPGLDPENPSTVLREEH
jgi:hypothetical protein